MILFLGFLYVASYFALAIRSSKTEASFSTVTVFGLGAFMYYVAIPLEMSVRKIDHFVLSGEAISVNSDLQLKLVLLGTMAFFAFVAGYKASGFRPFFLLQGSRPELADRIPAHIYVLTATSALATLAFYRSELAAVSTYQGHYTVAYSSPIFALLTEFTVQGLAIISGIVAARRRSLFVSFACVAPAFFWSIYSSDKDPMLLGALGFATRFIRPTRNYEWRVAVVVSLVVLMAGPLLELFSIYRANLTISSDDIGYTGLMLDRDPTGPLVSLVETVDARALKHRYGATYAEAVTLIVPKFLWPDRPLDLSEQFIRDRMTISWQPGQGMGYSLLAEAFLNFGWFGPAIQYFAIGLLWGHAWKLLQRYLVTNGFGYWKAVYCSLGYYTLLVMHRAPASFPVKHTIMILTVLWVFQVTAKWLALDRIAPPSAEPARALWSSSAANH